MSVPNREPKRSSDKYMNADPGLRPEEVAFDYSKPAPGAQTDTQPAAQSTTKAEPEYITVTSPKAYYTTGIAVFLAALAFPPSSIWSIIPLAIFGLVVFSIAKNIFKGQKYKVPVQHKITLTGFAETDEILKKADESLKNIQEVSEKISEKDAAYAETLDDLVADAYRIVDFTAENVAQATQLRRFYNYYLPTLEKLSRTYLSLEKGGEGERVTQTKEEIVSATEAMKSLFEKQFDKMYQNTAMDISTDVDVLESMLESDGIKATMGGH